MYSAFWGFRREPFGLGPDPALVCQSRQHDEALARLIYGVQFRKGLIALTGEPGTGKTTLLNCLRDFLQARRTDCVFLVNSRIDAAQLWELIASSLYMRCDPKSKVEVLHELRELLVDAARCGATTVLIVDEAQNLGSDVFEEIRLLGNLEDPSGRLLQIVLAGQPEFESKLDTPGLRSLKQRIAYRCCLHPLSEAQTSSYISARLEWAGMPEQTAFPPEVLAGIHFRSQGIPRLINTLCDSLLLTAFSLESRVTTLGMLDEVTASLRLEWDGSDSARKKMDPRVARENTTGLDTAFLARHGLSPAGFDHADGPAPAVAEGLDSSVLPPFEHTGELAPGRKRLAILVKAAASRLRPACRWTGNQFGEAGRLTLKAALALRLRLGATLRAVRSTVGPFVASAAGSHPRTLVVMSVLVCILGVVGLSKPARQWIRTLPEAVAAAAPIRAAEIVRPENAPSPADVERPTAGAASVEDVGPRVVQMDPARYTPAARTAGFRGKVFVVLTIDRQGNVKNLRFTGPMAFDLDTAVRRAASAWRFRPAKRDGESVEGKTLVEVPFR